ncbi:hypothetical protein NM688_g8812 [Phlebia brevispora]|uniref:Uncharacterized protein n=1 Tax=Phlebia brevispora TaxID=194682 RepID=A0ACC1RPF5_9APHY|nr:hypothetical protein NM688_g8812 [Phlebia brevispora]
MQSSKSNGMEFTGRPQSDQSDQYQWLMFPALGSRPTANRRRDGMLLAAGAQDIAQYHLLPAMKFNVQVGGNGNSNAL